MGFPIRADDEHANQLQNRVFYEFCEMIIHILGSPNVPVSFRALFGSGYVVRFSPSQISGAAFASLFLGISIALMMFGSVIFVIGFILMPWVVALVFLFYFVALLSSLSQLGRAILYPRSSSHKVGMSTHIFPWYSMETLMKRYIHQESRKEAVSVSS